MTHGGEVLLKQGPVFREREEREKESLWSHPFESFFVLYDVKPTA